MASITGWLFSIIVVVCTFLIISSEIIDLDNSNFEKLTVSNGDWLIKFYAPWCEHSQKLAPILERVADELKGLVSVGRVDVRQSKELGRRFDIKGFPTLALFSKGHIYVYQGIRSVEELVEFSRGGFQIYVPEIVPKELYMFHEIVLISRHVYKEATKDLLAGNFCTINVLCISLPIIFVFILLLVLFIPLPSLDKYSASLAAAAAKKNEKRNTEIPVSQLARPTISATDSFRRNVSKVD